MTSFSAPTPIFRIFDEAKAREFYLDYLGFAADWEHRFGDNFPLYMQVSRGGCRLHLSEHHGDCCPGGSVRVQVKGLDAFHSELAARNYKFARPGVEETPWKTREMKVGDPFGNRLIFFEPPPG